MDVRVGFLALILLAVLLQAGRARAEPPASIVLPTHVRCEAGLEESFNDPSIRNYELRIQPDPPLAEPYVLLSSFENLRVGGHRQRPLGRAKTTGRWTRQGPRLAFVAKSFVLSVTAEAVSVGADPVATLLVSGRGIPARCGFAGTKPPLTAGIALLRSPPFVERLNAAREALSDDYQIVCWRIDAKQKGDRATIAVELRKQRSESCSSLPDRRTKSVPYARVDGELTGSVADGFRIERASLEVLAPSPPDPAPSAERVAERYRNARSGQIEYRAGVQRRGIFARGSKQGILRFLPGALSLRHDDGTHLVRQGETWLGYAPASARRDDAVMERLPPYASALGFLG